MKTKLELVESMLENLIDAHYGTSLHHIGDGDGLSDDDAAEIREWMEQRQDENRRKVFIESALKKL